MATKNDLLEYIVDLLSSAMSKKNVAKRKKGYKRVSRKPHRIPS